MICRVAGIYFCLYLDKLDVNILFALFEISTIGPPVVRPLHRNFLSTLLAALLAQVLGILDTDTAVDSSASTRHCLNRRPLDFESPVLICPSIDTLSL
jgi:hypothetical protein